MMETFQECPNCFNQISTVRVHICQARVIYQVSIDCLNGGSYLINEEQHQALHAENATHTHIDGNDHHG